MASVTSAGTSTARLHATQPWCDLPASKLRLTDSAHARSPAWMGLLRARGRACSISRANRMAKKLMEGNDTGASPWRAPSRARQLQACMKR